MADDAEHESPDDAPAHRSRWPRGGPNWGTVIRDVLLGIVLLLMLWLAFHVRLPSADHLRDDLGAWGGAAWLGFILLYALVAITPIPISIMAVAGGVLFGVVEGSILSVIGAFLGSWAAYWLARALGKSVVKRLLGRHAATVEAHLENAGVEAVYLLRLMPGIPYWPVNYGSGAFGISQRDFLVGSSLSTVPGQVSLVAIGAFIADPAVLPAVIVGAAWAVVLIMTIFAYRRLKRASRR
ncbi:TVP38/TMEM64 family protein [Leucobacter sp. GX24907]